MSRISYGNILNQIEEFKVGYRISEDSIYKDMLPELKTIGKDNKVILQEYQEGDISELLQHTTVAVFVDIAENSYVVYQSNDKKTEAAVTERV